MTTGINSLEDKSDWQKLYNLLPAGSKSPFFSPEYYRSYSKIENCKVDCYCQYSDEGNFLFYPFLIRSINTLGYNLEGDYFDIAGAYGYNGPIGVVTDESFLNTFNEELQIYIKHKNIVTEFARYCPITGNRKLHTYTTQTDVLDNVYIDVSRGPDWVWNKSFEYGVRKSVRKGESYGLRTDMFRAGSISTEVLGLFFKIYYDTMQRNQADSYYFFEYDFFEKLAVNMGDMIVIALTFLKDLPITAELLLVEEKLAFGFLGGTLSDYYEYKANTFQRWELLKYLHTLGVDKYSMGGGASRGDSIYSFKKSFAKECENPFYIGTQVHLPEVYSKIIAQWQERCPGAAERYSGRLQGYRLQV